MSLISNFSLRAYAFLPFLLPFLFARKVPVFYHHRVSWIVLTILYTYAVPPMLDAIGGRNVRNSFGDKTWRVRGFEYVNLPRLLMAKILVLKIMMLMMVATGRFGLIDCIGIGYLTGQTIGSYGIFIAHELLHRKSRVDRLFAEILMSTVLYTHFCIEHIHGHHKHAATPEDPASSRLDETVYAFLPRSIFGGMRHSVDLEAAHLRQRGFRWLGVHNRILRYLLVAGILLLLIYACFGVLALLAFVVQSVVAVVTLEVINYVQHYGLCRKRNAEGRYERVTQDHSWNSQYRFSNGYWLNLGRHSDHHVEANRSFQQLRSFERAPELPYGLPAMFLLAWIPSLWFRIMNPRVKAWQEQQLVGNALQSSARPRTSSVARHRTGPSVHIAEAGHGDGARQVWWFGWLERGALVLSISALLGLDIFWGAPRGLITLAVLCLAIVSVRRLLEYPGIERGLATRSAT